MFQKFIMLRESLRGGKCDNTPLGTNISLQVFCEGKGLEGIHLGGEDLKSNHQRGHIPK